MPTPVPTLTGRATIAALVALAAVLSLGVALQHAPPNFENAWGFAPEGRPFVVFQAGSEPWPIEWFVAALRSTLVLAWTAWSMVLVAALRRDPPVGDRTAWAITVCAPIAVMAMFPPMLSRDVLGYVAYGRLPGLYGLNPYIESREALTALDDSTGDFLVWDTPLPYGPLWTLLAAGIGKLSGGGDPALEVLLHKGFAALALIGTACAIRLLVRGRNAGNLSMLSVAASPLLLVEGPAGGHNDALMMALMAAAALATSRRRYMVGALVLGTAIAIKPIALAALPFVVGEYLLAGRGAIRAAGLGALALMPTLVLSSVFGGPEVLVAAVVRRAVARQVVAISLIGLAATAAVVVGLVLLRRGVQVERPAPWFTAWAPLALVIGLIVLPVRFPWYVTWSLVPVLAELDDRNVPLLTTVVVLGALVTWRYAVPL